MWSYVVAETLTGKPVQDVTALVTKDVSWKRQLNGYGTGKHGFHLGASPFTRSQHRYLFQPWTHSIFQCWNRTPVYGGPFVSGSWNGRNSVLTVNSVELRVILSRRLLYSLGTWVTHDIYSADARRAMAYFLRLALITGNPNPARWAMPVDIPGHVGGTRNDKVYRYHFKTSEEVVAAISDEDGGPDLDFRPYRVADSDWFRWEARIGDPAAGGLLTGPSFEWSLNGSNAQDVSQDWDGLPMTTGVFTPGEGNDEVRPYGQAALETGLEPYQGPYLDKVVSFTQEDRPDRLNSNARGILRAFQQPKERSGFSVRADLFPQVDQFVPGMRIRGQLPGDAWTTPGWSPFQYVLGYSGDGGKRVTFEVKE